MIIISERVSERVHKHKDRRGSVMVMAAAAAAVENFDREDSRGEKKDEDF